MPTEFYFKIQYF